MKLNFASTRLAFFLIASLLALILLSAIIPQEDISSGQIVDLKKTLGDSYTIVKKLGLDRIYYTPTFFIVLGLLAVNLAAGNIRRFRSVYRVERSLLKLRHLGSIIFHLSLLAIMAGVILNFLYRYEGVFALTEGQSASDSQTEYFREFKGPLYAENYGSFKLRLDSLEVVDDNQAGLGSLAFVSLNPRSGAKIESSVSTNHPLQWNDIEFHFGSGVGYSPELIIRDTSQLSGYRTFVRLSRRVNEGTVSHRDYVMVKSLGLKAEIEVIPSDTGKTVSHQVRLYSSTDSLLISRRLATAEEAKYGPYEFTVFSVRRWCYIGAIRNPFLGLIFFGFWSALGGMVVSFIPRVLTGKP